MFKHQYTNGGKRTAMQFKGGDKKNDERPKSKFWTFFDLILNDCT